MVTFGRPILGSRRLAGQLPSATPGRCNHHGYQPGERVILG
jgi:hypothetical protein